jgi:hypothetical protein
MFMPIQVMIVQFHPNRSHVFDMADNDPGPAKMIDGYIAYNQFGFWKYGFIQDR